MKKIIVNAAFLVLLLTVCVSFNSCDKEGVYNPKQKIKKIYEEYSGGPKVLTEGWTWEKKHLTKIDYYDDNEIYSTNRFFYEKNRLVKVENDDKDYSVITYDGNKYKKVEAYSEGELFITLNYHYDKNKVSKIDIVFHDINFDYYKKLEKGSLSTLISKEIILQIINQLANNDDAKVTSSMTATITFKYDGDNVKEEVMETISKYEPMPGVKYQSNNKQTLTFNSYDNMQNPYYKFLETGGELSSKNNPLDVNIVQTFTFTTSTDYPGLDPITNTTTSTNRITYTYTYEKKYPVKIVEVYQIVGGYQLETTTYYEYQ